MNEADEVIYIRFLEERNEEDLKTLLERHRDSLVLFLYGYIHNMDDAEDLMMDTFATIVSGNVKYRVMEKSSFKTWLFSIGRNLTMNFLRKHKREFASAYAQENIESEADTPPLLILTEERNRQIYRGMEQLNPEYREVLYLYYFEQMEHDEIGRVMKKNTKQVYNLLTRGRKSLKENLERMGFENAEF
ncbi:MAG: RNA polymerase sigma factor [Lachnospiraceae bacterium]|nr:RNA polymerase sigma factor [Lachnospiraceae bacterium]